MPFCCLFHPFHAQLHPSSLQIDSDDADEDVLVELDFLGGVFDEVVGEFADVDEAFGVDTHIDEAAEVGDVGDDAGEGHADLHVFQFFHIFGELEHGELLARVAAGLVEFLHDVVQGGEAYFVGHILLNVNLFADGFVGH